MKKFLLTALLASAMTPAFASSISEIATFSFDGKPLVSGQTVVVNTYYDPIVKEYPDLAEDPDWEYSYESQALVVIDNNTGSKKNATLNLALAEPSSLDDAVGTFQLCPGNSDGDANCFGPQNNEITKVWGLPANGWIHCDIHHADFTDPTKIMVLKMTVEIEGADDAFEVNLRFTNEYDITAAVGGIESESASPVFYNLQGVHVSEPQKGQLYIVRKGSKTTKRIF